MPSRPRVERIGHRGAPKEHLENTIPSFRRAVELGATALELDVHVTADGVPVVHHDPELHFDVTPARFAGTRIATLHQRDIAEIQLKSGDPIPTLEAVLRTFTPAIKVYVEIKGGSPAIIAAALTPFKDSVAVHSFDHAVIVEMHRLAPTTPRGILFDRLPPDLAGLVRETGASDLWPPWKLVDEAFMQTARDLGARVIPWTVNSARQCRRLAALGVAGICTNDVTLLKELQ